MKRLPIIISIFLGLCAGACGSSDASEDTSSTDIVVEKRDSAVYLLGRAHARRMLEQCRTTDELRTELLDIRARESAIKSKMTPEAAQAYIQGFRHYIQENDDTLALTLFAKNLPDSLQN